MLNAEDDLALIQAIAEADRGDMVDGDDVIKNIS